MSVVVVAEKPSVARDLARVLGAGERGDGHLRGGDYVVTWAIGHLLRLAEPHEIRPEWKRWSADALPLLPSEWPLLVAEETRAQFAIVKRLLTAKDVARVVCATDAGREGELIFRYIYAAAGCRKPVQRLWISSLTPEAIRKGFVGLRPWSDFDPLADAACGRARADWLVGMNLSRAATLAHGEMFSVGRVQTPTLALLVERELAIRAFVPEDYLEVVARFGPGASAADPWAGAGFNGHHAQPEGLVSQSAAPLHAGGSYRGTWFRGEKPSADAKRLPRDGVEAQAIVARARRGQAAIESVVSETRRLAPPLLYDLTELQRHANRLYGLSARQTLAAAQALYEKHKLVTYPRSDSRHLSADVAATLPSVVEAITAPYRGLLAEGTDSRPLSRRFVDDAKVGDHHAIIPTAGKAAGLALPLDQSRVYDLVCRRLLMAWHDEHVFAVTTVITRIETPADGDKLVDRYHSSGTAIQQAGWKVLDPPPPARPKAPQADEAASESDGAQELPKGLAPGQPRSALDVETVGKRTRPPRRYTDATLLTAMETAGESLLEQGGMDARELSEAMREHGLGTPATRAEIIETLLRREYVQRLGKSLEATEKGIRLIACVPDDVKSPALTGQWEAELLRIQRGQAGLDGFLRRIEDFVRALVEETLSGGSEGRAQLPAAAVPAPPATVAAPPVAVPASPARVAVPSAPVPAAPGPAASAPAAPPSPSAPAGASAAAARSVPIASSAPALPVVSAAAAPPRLVPRPVPPASVGASHAAVAPLPVALVPMPVATTASPVAVPPLPASPAALGDGGGGRLEQLLHDRLRLHSFRPYQEAVCRAVTQGEDVLLVMPTGAGKSLCYQLPGLARGGTTLVVSPLIALMEDQVAKLQALGLRAERIHSGRDRAESRQVCQAYLAGRIDFLFVAPERLRVPGFPELLARHKPALVAIDEAHCISEWGHDFRPDYRLLGERLPALRPAPVVALTATATPRVQDDIAAQLGLERGRRFIHGFRRTNIAIEVAQVKQGAERAAAVRAILEDPGRRPAIVYAPTRKEADALAEELRGDRLRAAAYHAGMAAPARDRVQAAFLAGELDLIVATIAFGMGVDKPDVRTVVHTGLPSSVEGYYQEIGRAGRDGKPSRAVLLFSFADRRTHEFFYERDYPEPEVLDALFRALPLEPEPIGELRARLRFDADEFDTALDKLWIHGGARVDGERVSASGKAWRRADYVRQREHKKAQLDEIMRYAEAHACRMLCLVRHFGDQEDNGRPCGLCDVCVPHECLVRRYRPPTATERQAIGRIHEALRLRDRQGAAQLHRESGGEALIDRDGFERLLGGLARAGLVQVTRDSFEKDGRTIAFQRVALAAAARAGGFDDLGAVAITEEAPARSRGKRGKQGTARTRHAAGAGRALASRAVGRHAARTGATLEGSRRPGPASPPGPRGAVDLAPDALVAALKAWRLAEARRQRVPAFRILSDRTLLALAHARPASESGLLAVPGLGPRLVARYGAPLLRLVGPAR